MKLLFIVIDGMGDLPVEALGFKTPLEAAVKPNMDFLAKNGRTGLLYTVKKGIAPESDVAVISLLGYDPFTHCVGRGILEAIGADLNVADGDLSLRCNFATIGHQKNIVDRRVGRTLTIEEVKQLCEAINKGVKLESHKATFEFKPMLGHRAVLVIKCKDTKLSSKITNSDPAYAISNGLGVVKIGAEMILGKVEPTDDTFESNVSANLINEFIQKSTIILENHEVNAKRSLKGKLEANAVLTRDASHLKPAFSDINQKYGVDFLALIDMHAERGIAKLAGMFTPELPPPEISLKEECELRVKQILELYERFDCFYVHLKGPDEPGHDGDYKRKTELISLIDKHFFGNLLPKILLKDNLICVTSDHATPCKLKGHSDTPVAALIAGGSITADHTVAFSEKDCVNGSLGVIDGATLLMARLIAMMKK
jgi:2,3-bisphosphoglycerate-independent phosphoglycerate mutase